MSDREVRAYVSETGKCVKGERGREESVQYIDFFFFLLPFLKLIKVLARFSNYRSAYRGFLLPEALPSTFPLLLLLLCSSTLSTRCLFHHLFT